MKTQYGSLAAAVFVLLAATEAQAFCRARALKRVRGCYIPTAKNRLVEGHYAGLGFREQPADGKSTAWIFDMSEDERVTHHITIREE